MQTGMAALAALLSYLLGAIPFAYLLGKARGVDIRTRGSGNIGATNIGRILGRQYGYLTFFLDAAKGAIPVLAAGLLGKRLGWEWGGSRGLMAICGASAIAGHVWPVFLGFRGGKGVATTIGVAGVLSWPATLIGLVVWLLGAYLLRYVFLGSVLFALTLPISYLLLYRERAWTEDPAVILLLAGVAVLVAVRHRSNFRRFLAREEEKFGEKDKEPG